MSSVAGPGTGVAVAGKTTGPDRAGDGYVYLTKHVAKGDATESHKPDAVDYYVAMGTPPGT